MRKSTPKSAILLFLVCFTSLAIAGSTRTILTTFADDPDPSQVFYGYVVSFTLEPEASPPTLTGTITATDGKDSCVATLPELNCVLIPMTPGPVTINATYSGDVNYAPDDANPLTHEVVAFQLPEIISRGDGIGPGLFPNQASWVVVSDDAQHVAVATSFRSIFYESYKTPPRGVFVYDIPDKSWDLVSVDNEGNPPTEGAVFSPSISSNGRYVAFITSNSDLGLPETSHTSHAFWFDRVDRTLRLVSKDLSEVPALARTPAVSGDGRFVAFETGAHNLVPGDNAYRDIFVWDNNDDSIRRVSVDKQGNEALGHSEAPAISADGRYVTFQSDAENLVPGDTNTDTDIFVYDLQDGSIERVSINSDGIQGEHDSENPDISGDGRYVAFESASRNLAPGIDFGYDRIFVHDRTLNTTELVSLKTGGIVTNDWHYNASISSDGGFVTFETESKLLDPADTNSFRDIYIYNRGTDTTTRVSRTAADAPANGHNRYSDVSINGGRVVYMTAASNMVEVPYEGVRQYPVVTDPNTGTRPDIRLTASPAGSLGNGDSEYISLSQDGRYAAFSSTADNLVADDSNGVADIFVRDRLDQSIERVSVTTGGVQGNKDSLNPAISSDGKWVLFESQSSSLIGTGRGQIFMYDRDSSQLSLISKDINGGTGNGNSTFAAISADSKYVAFHSTATNLVVLDANGIDNDLFIYHVDIDLITRVVSPDDSGVNGAYAPSISGDGRYIAFVTSEKEVWVWDRLGGTLIPTFDGGGQPLNGGNGRVSISGNGQLLATRTFSGAPDYENELKVYDFQTLELETISATATEPFLSADGRFLVARELLNNRFQIHVFDLSSGTSRLISRDPLGNPGNEPSAFASLSPDGQFIGFESEASNLVPNDSSGRQDVLMFENPLFGTPPGVLFYSGFEAGEQN